MADFGEPDWQFRSVGYFSMPPPLESSGVGREALNYWEPFARLFRNCEDRLCTSACPLKILWDDSCRRSQFFKIEVDKPDCAFIFLGSADFLIVSTVVNDETLVDSRSAVSSEPLPPRVHSRESSIPRNRMERS